MHTQQYGMRLPARRAHSLHPVIASINVLPSSKAARNRGPAQGRIWPYGLAGQGAPHPSRLLHPRPIHLPPAQAVAHGQGCVDPCQPSTRPRASHWARYQGPRTPRQDALAVKKSRLHSCVLQPSRLQPVPCTLAASHAHRASALAVPGPAGILSVPHSQPVSAINGPADIPAGIQRSPSGERLQGGDSQPIGECDGCAPGSEPLRVAWQW